MQILEQYIKGDFREVLDWVKTPMSPIKTGFCQKLTPPHPEWWVATFALGKNPIGHFLSKRVTASAGTSIHVEEALYSALGEALERYSSINSYLIDEEMKEMPFGAETNFNYARCAGFEPAQPSFQSGGCNGLNIDHTKVQQLTTGKDFWVPAEHIHLGYMRYDRRMMHTAPISTGCAFYYDTTTAIWKGLCEYVERDAMMRFWHLRQDATRIDLSGVNDSSIRTRLHRLRQANLELHLFEISSVIDIPTCYAVIQSDTYPYWTVGASTNSDLDRAVCKAIDESVSIRTMAVWNGFDFKEEKDYAEFSWVNELETHMALYANWKSTPAFDFFLNCSPTATLEEIRQLKPWLQTPKHHSELRQRCQEIEEKGFTVLWKDISIPETLKYGNTIKVLIPEMLPLSQNFSNRWLHGLGVTDPSSVNPYPHPFS